MSVSRFFYIKIKERDKLISLSDRMTSLKKRALNINNKTNYKTR